MSPAFRLSLFYAAAFLLVGIQLPFWPTWLAGRGLDPAEIAEILAVALWLKVVASPLAGGWADRSGRRRGVMVALAAIALAAFLLFLPAQGFWPLLLINALSTAAASALLPLGDNLAVTIAYARSLDYGRLRLWGSLSFILGALVSGSVLSHWASEAVLLLLIVAAALNLGACANLPDHPFKRAGSLREAWRPLLADRRQLLFLAAATAIQASHSVYYAFATLHWTRLGFSGTTIGILWSESVVVEVALFAASARLVARLGPARLLLLAGAAGVVRWTVTGLAQDLPLLFAVQSLHALTFGAAHLGAMHYLARALPPELSATGQALYSATVSGIGYGLVMVLAGRLYAEFGSNAYFAMAVLAAIGAAAAALLGRAWHGERLDVALGSNPA